MGKYIIIVVVFLKNTTIEYSLGVVCVCVCLHVRVCVGGGTCRNTDK